MAIRKALISAAMVVGMAAGGIGAMAPAFASEGDGVIQSGEFVGWRDCNTGSPFFDFAGDHTNYNSIYFVNDVYKVNDMISLVYNTSTVNSVNAFVDNNYVGARLVLLPGQMLNLCGTATAFNDKLSSHHF